MSSAHRLRDESGLVALEFMMVVGAWLLSLAFLLNICILLGNGVVMQATVNRAALQATAQGCVSPQSAASAGRLTTLLSDNITLNAVWVDRQPGGGFDRQGAIAAVESGDTSGLCLSPVGLGGDFVPEGDYIFLDLEYDQDMLLFPTVHVRKTALAVSSSLNLEDPSGQEAP